MDLDREAQKYKEEREYGWEHYQARDVQTEDAKESSVSHWTKFCITLLLLHRCGCPEQYLPSF